MKRNKKIIVSILAVLVSIGILFRFDPAFKRDLTFAGHTVEYDWRIFNSIYCNYISNDHCRDNNTNKLNAEIELCRYLLDNFNGDQRVEQKLKEIVSCTYRLDMAYGELPGSNEIKIDTLRKYKEQIFRPIRLK